MTKPQSLLARPYAAAAVVGGLAVATALVVRARTKTAEAANPPMGRFVEVDGVRLHYVERGTGEPLVLLHGNGSMVQDFWTSGFVALAAKYYRVIAFDRPGYGHSERPRTTVWTPDAQADLLHAALAKIGVARFLLLGHSWGASVAVALGLNYPQAVRGLVLESGYYYPSVRADVVLMSGPAVPVLGDVLRYTVSPLLARLMWPAMLRKLFGPAPVAESFASFPSAMTMRPSQLRASAAESALMIPDAIAAQGHYGDLAMPVAIVSGVGDKIVDVDHQARRLHREIAHSTLHIVPDCGHMVHHTAPRRVMAAVDAIAQAA